MKKLKKFLLPFLFYIPFGAWAIAPVAVALIVGATVIAGFSIYRSLVPLDINSALTFFSSCWSCQMFSDIVRNLSDFIPKIYRAVGQNIVPIAAGLTFVWFLWEKILKGYLTIKPELDAWKITADFSTQIIKLAFVASLLMFPLPRFMMDTFITPIMGIGLSYNHIARNYIEPDDASFDTCMVATALTDPSNPGDQAYSPKLRHNMTCQIAEFHRITGLGMTVGWAFMQMSFDGEYMYKAGPVPIFPNIGLILVGMLILLAFLWALFPIPVYFLEVFITLSMDLVMLPLFLLGWLFKGWNIFPQGATGKSIRGIVDDAVKNTCGIALAGLFAGFAILFLNSVIGQMNGVDALVYAIQNNDSKYLMDSLMLNNGGLVGIIMIGIFIGMFMNAIPRLIKLLFKNMNFTDDVSKPAKELQEAISQNLKHIYDGIKGKIKILTEPPSTTQSPATPPAPTPPPTP